MKIGKSTVHAWYRLMLLIWPIGVLAVAWLSLSVKSQAQDRPSVPPCAACGVPSEQKAGGTPSGDNDPQPSHAILPLAAERGGPGAPITILEFSDFQCPFCRQAATVVNELLQAYPDKIRLLFKHTPLPIHPKSNLVHEAVLAAGAQGKFWEMHGVAFANP